MKATVTINSRGVVTLPAKLRQALGLKADDQLIAETTSDGLLLRPAVTLPVEVYTPEREREFEITADAKVLRMGLGHGAVRGGVAETTLRSDLSIETPTATLSKRGTIGFRI